ncbi:metallophosphoesterase [Mucilaginibacter pallidiroseus]|uniref:Metallophosphoesterase n=1 Tax=Mucilaginibacter pallidiroseus TaxID=2599295 RepID=A0A563UJ67_9SPHI|nr:metallophosphoesterase [Mucilaginibacter pallidiroseus]TWR31430.1 metallophosphoesterase [Mucilaginibacter pallidiroseus]
MRYKTPVIKQNQPNDEYKFRALPQPTGKYPYHLDIGDVINAGFNDRMIFHLVGDTGGSIAPEARQNIVKRMTGRLDGPSFLYHLGDIVYHYGEADQYESQFFKSFEDYPGPIFAIAGNHDSDVNPDAKVPYQSLDAFKSVFCDTVSKRVSFSGDSKRQSMIQPNVYWTLETPLATFIGMYSNVPKFGIITPDQQQWLRNELLSASSDKFLIICLHHAPYSADTNHGSSLPMIKELNDAFTETGVLPDVVFSGHVHNYQRFEKVFENNKAVPFIVAGGGGFNELHSIATLDDNRFTALNENKVTLQAFNESAHGFLKIDIQKKDGQLTLSGEYYAMDHVLKPFDVFNLSKSVG